MSPARWKTAGAAVPAAENRGGWELAIGNGSEPGGWSTELPSDSERNPYLAFEVTTLSRECAWSLAVVSPNGKQRSVLQPDAAGFGHFAFDLRKAKEAVGGGRPFLQFIVRGPAGRSNWIVLKEPGLYRTDPFGQANAASFQPLLAAERMNRALVNAGTDEVSLALMNAPGAEWEWGGALAKVTVDTDRFPFAELNVKELSANANFRFGVGGMTSGPVDRYAGVLSFNYRDASHWQGPQTFAVQTILGGAGGHLAYAPVRFVPFPSLSRPLVEMAEASPVVDPAPDLELTTGSFRLGYESKSGLFRIRKTGGSASIATRFLEMQGITLTPATVTKSKNAAGDHLAFQHQADNIRFSVDVETFAAVEGLLHWRVTATSGGGAHFASCGHELCYTPGPEARGASLLRLASQSWSASGMTHVVAPGVGGALYFQNYTALNPLFERCHTSPRCWVSASAKTFGFPNPMDTRATFPAQTPLVLSDVWLYLFPEEPRTGKQDNLRDAAAFVQGLAAILNQLPDKPATEWLDWQKLARTSLQDLYTPECWSSWENGIYLQAYVGTVGASPQITGMQDVIGPLLDFLNQTGEGRDMYNRLRAEIPHFWSEKKGSLLLFANDPNSNWWSIEQMIGVCRAALNGDADAKTYCLKSGPALMKLAQDSHYGFRNFGVYKDLKIDEREFTGAYLLYMMQLYELSGDRMFVEEAKHAAEQVATWDYAATKLAAWMGMTCEGLARLYQATGEKNYLTMSQIPLAGLLHNAWLWQCTYGHAKGYTTFFGFNSDASGVDYITAADQHQVWYSLYQYYLRSGGALSAPVQYLVAEALRYIPQVAWYTYPTHLPAASLHVGVPFWHSKNIFTLAIPVEDLNDGWRKNGSVGQELYGAGAAFDFATRAYVRVPEAGVLVYCEYPILKTAWAADHKLLTVQIGGVPGQSVKFEVRTDPTAPTGLLGAKGAHLAITLRSLKANTTAPSISRVLEEGELRMTVPSDSEITLTPDTTPRVAR
ncbi:MAG: hypothetical protein JWN14_1541 [Chthonomonadales bacterium]|nr:hypothetical protein [Chthonomonadales bacterium]